jgi:hypothetical protein
MLVDRGEFGLEHPIVEFDGLASPFIRDSSIGGLRMVVLLVGLPDGNGLGWLIGRSSKCIAGRGKEQT